MAEAIVRPPPAPTETTETILVLGVICNEKQYAWRERLRHFYLKHTQSRQAVVRYVLDEAYFHQRSRITRSDEVTVPVTRGGNRHCAHKALGWWRLAAQWPASFYGKTDDDAVIDLPPLLSLLQQIPAGVPSFTGIIRYSSLNETTLAGQCWGAGPGMALRLRSRKCAGAESFGPFPYAEGPLIVASARLQQWVAPRLKLSDRQTCHFEDLLFARAVAPHPAVFMLNLVSLIGNKDVVISSQQKNAGRWVGSQGFLAHWTRADKHFKRAVAEFPLKRKMPAPVLQCASWASSFQPVKNGDFPCCRNWTLCEPGGMVSPRRGRKRRPGG